MAKKKVKQFVLSSLDRKSFREADIYTELASLLSRSMRFPRSVELLIKITRSKINM